MKENFSVHSSFYELMALFSLHFVKFFSQIPMSCYTSFFPAFVNFSFIWHTANIKQKLFDVQSKAKNIFHWESQLLSWYQWCLQLVFLWRNAHSICSHIDMIKPGVVKTRSTNKFASFLEPYSSSSESEMWYSLSFFNFIYFEGNKHVVLWECP